jgi:hypothetical protein
MFSYNLNCVLVALIDWTLHAIPGFLGEKED